VLAVLALMHQHVCAVPVLQITWLLSCATSRATRLHNRLRTVVFSVGLYGHADTVSDGLSID
jgi:hypothetical protein